MMKTVYAYSGETGEFIGFTQAQESPLEPGVFAYPPNSTDVCPPDVQTGYARVFKNGEWSHVLDFRGTIIYDAEGNESVVKELGAIPEGYTTEKPILASSIRVDVKTQLYILKSKVAYRGITIVKDGQSYTFETDKDSISLSSASLLAMASLEDTTLIGWKVYQGDKALVISITKAELAKIFGFGMTMIRQAFGVEGSYLATFNDYTDEYLKTEFDSTAFLAQAKTSFDQVVTQFSLDA